MSIHTSTILKTFAEILSQSTTISEEVKPTKIRRRVSKTTMSILNHHYPDISGRTERDKLINVFTHFMGTSELSVESPFTDWSEIVGQLDKVFKLLFTSEGYLLQALAKIRALFKGNRSLRASVINATGISQQASLDKRNNTIKKVISRNMKLDLPVVYLDQVLGLIAENKASKSVHRRIIALMLASASRKIEILRMSQFEKVGVDLVKVTHLAKKNEVGSVTRRLVGLSVDEFLEILAGVRVVVDSKAGPYASHQEVADKFSNTLNNNWKKLIRPILKENKPTVTDAELKRFPVHSTRALGAHANFVLYGKGSRLSTYLQIMLGHENPSATTHYLPYSVEDRLDKESGKESVEIAVDKGSDKESDKEPAKESDKELAKPINSALVEIRKDISMLKEMIINKASPDDAISGSFDAKKYANTREDPSDVQVEKIVKCLDEIESRGITITQRALRQLLGYSSIMMTRAYKVRRSR